MIFLFFFRKTNNSCLPCTPGMSQFVTKTYKPKIIFNFSKLRKFLFTAVMCKIISVSALFSPLSFRYFVIYLKTFYRQESMRGWQEVDRKGRANNTLIKQLHELPYTEMVKSANIWLTTVFSNFVDPDPYSE